MSTYAGEKKMRIALTSEDGENLLTLPFTHKSTYHSAEQPLIDSINQSLTDSNIEYTQEDFHGVLRYRIPKMGKRQIARLQNAISSSQDAFIKLCGEREVIGINSL